MDIVKGKCKTCLGCSQLEDEAFTGKWNCDNYRMADTKQTFVDHICKDWEIKYQQQKI